MDNLKDFFVQELYKKIRERGKDGVMGKQGVKEANYPVPDLELVQQKPKIVQIINKVGILVPKNIKSELDASVHNSEQIRWFSVFNF